MSGYYHVVEGKYHFFRGNRISGDAFDELALAFSEPLFKGDIHTLLHHGSPEKVEPWVNAARQGFRAAGFPQMADKIYCVKGRFSEENVNRLLDKQLTLKRFLDISGVDVHGVKVSKRRGSAFGDTVFGAGW